MLRIGNVTLATNLLLAPIARFTDLAFRLTIRRLGGLGLACTDLVNPRGLLRQTVKTMALVETDPADRPLCVQLYGANADEMAAAAQWCQDHGAAIVDMNMGCPAEKVCRRGGGAALLAEPRTAVRVAQRVVEAVRIPVTAKMRLGWSGEHLIASSLAHELEDVGIAAVIVHGRSVEQKFSGTVCVDAIARVVESVRTIPVIGNGDIRCPADAKAMIDRSGCAGVMIGRAALRDPWIFRDTQAFLATGQAPPPVPVRERIEFMNRHFAHLMRLRGERVAVIRFRQRFSWYASRLGVSREFADRMRALRSAQEYHELVGKLTREEDRADTPDR